MPTKTLIAQEKAIQAVAVAFVAGFVTGYLVHRSVRRVRAVLELAGWLCSS